MALNLYGKTNYEVDVPFSIAYSREPAMQKSQRYPTQPTQWRYTRKATKTYNFKGMTEIACKACLDEKQRQYMRLFMPWKRLTTSYSDYYHCPDEYHFSPFGYLEEDPYRQQVAQFNVSRTSDAPVFDLQITVDETIALFSTYDYDPGTLSGCQHIEQLFSTQTLTPADERIQGDQSQGGPRYLSYLYQYDYDENLQGDTIVNVQSNTQSNNSQEVGA